MITIYGEPRTKKNSLQIYKVKYRTYIMPSKAYQEYEKLFKSQVLKYRNLKLNEQYNVKCLYYMKTKRKIDLSNLLSATCDCLVSSGILEDDNSSIIIAHDGSRVLYDKDNPRVEIYIEKLQ